MEKDGKDIWDKISIAAQLVGVTLIPAAIGIATFIYTQSYKEREFSREWVKTSLEILRDEQGGPALRTWAVKTLNHYAEAGTRIDAALAQQLVEGKEYLPQVAPAAPEAPGRFSQVMALQESSLSLLLGRDIGGAIAAMEKAHATWHDFRTVWEILTLMRAHKDELAGADDHQWAAFYGEVLRTWDLRGINQELREKLSTAAKSA